MILVMPDVGSHVVGRVARLSAVLVSRICDQGPCVIEGATTVALSAHNDKSK